MLAPFYQIVVIQWDAVHRQDTIYMLASVLSRARRLGTSFKVLLNKADQIEAEGNGIAVLEEETALALEKINKVLDLVMFTPFVARAMDLREEAHRQGQSLPSLADVANVCFLVCHPKH